MFLNPQTVIEHFNISEGMQIADFGVGRGDFLFLTGDQVGNYGRVYAVDILPEAIEAIKSEARIRNLSNINFIRGDLEQMTGSRIADNVLDRVMVINTLFQTTNKENVLKEASRVLKPNGKLILIDWKDSYTHLGPHPHHIISEDEAKYFASLADFILHKDFHAGDHHYGFIFEKNMR